MTARTSAEQQRLHGRLLGGVVIVAVLTACGPPVTQRSGLITGTVYSAPSCPVERITSPCPPRPVDGAVVDALVASHVRARTHTDSFGRFHLSLPYGSYTIRATNVGALHTTVTQNVQVGQPTASITLVVDSGIR